jgi:hypothetical protein
MIVGYSPLASLGILRQLGRDLNERHKCASHSSPRFEKERPVAGTVKICQVNLYHIHAYTCRPTV